MQKKEKFLLATIFSVVAILSVLPMISAATMSPVIYAPTNSSNHTGSFTVNCNVSHAASNVTVVITDDTGTTNVSAALTGYNISNVTADFLNWSGAVTLTSTYDGANWNISCYADNGTDQANSAGIGSTYHMFDTTDPICNISVGHSSIEWKGIQTITWDSSDAIELVTTLVTIDRPEDAADITDSDASEVRTLTSQETKYVGDWTATILGTDRVGLTCTETVTFKSYHGDVPDDRVPTPVSKKGLWIIVGILAIIAYFYFKEK